MFPEAAMMRKNQKRAIADMIGPELSHTSNNTLAADSLVGKPAPACY